MFVLVVDSGVVVRHLPILTLHMHNQWLKWKRERRLLGEDEDEDTKEGVEAAACGQVVRVAVAQVPFANL